MNNAFIAGLKFVTIDFLGDFVYWPVWWYTLGLRDRLVWFIEQVKSIWKVLALGLWLKNFFVPMYADRSILGRGISLVMRVIILIWKLAWFFSWMILVLAILILWIAAPPLAVYMIIRQI